MQVTITCTIQIPDDAQSINELDGRIHNFGLSLMRELLSQRRGRKVSAGAGHVRCVEANA